MGKKFKIIKEVDISGWSWGDIITKYSPPTWEAIFEGTAEERQIIARVLEDQLLHCNDFYPRKENLYKAFELTRLEEVKVVILGQDPYPQKMINGEPKARGLSFSIAKEDGNIPSSLRNIFAEIEREYKEAGLSYTKPKNGDLSGWARQGVLLLNMALTIIPGERNSHRGIWKSFITKTLKELLDANPDIILVLWGHEAGLIKRYIKGEILESGHPSSEAVNRGGNFIGNGHFLDINRRLEKIGRKPIVW